jgi:hypothetical protein
MEILIYQAPTGSWIAWLVLDCITGGQLNGDQVPQGIVAKVIDRVESEPLSNPIGGSPVYESSSLGPPVQKESREENLDPSLVLDHCR